MCCKVKHLKWNSYFVWMHTSLNWTVFWSFQCYVRLMFSKLYLVFVYFPSLCSNFDHTHFGSRSGNSYDAWLIENKLLHFP
jgi:hypothetical protein